MLYSVSLCNVCLNQSKRQVQFAISMALNVQLKELLELHFDQKRSKNKELQALGLELGSL